MLNPVVNWIEKQTLQLNYEFRCESVPAVVNRIEKQTLYLNYELRCETVWVYIYTTAVVS